MRKVPPPPRPHIQSASARDRGLELAAEGQETTLSLRLPGARSPALLLFLTLATALGAGSS